MTESGKFCTRVPNQRLRKVCTWPEYLSLAAPHCAVFILNGDADVIIDKDGDGTAWNGTRRHVAEAAPNFPDGHIACWFEPEGGHRPYHGYKITLEWIHHHLGTPGWSLDQIRALPTVNLGQWCDNHNITIEKLYGTTLHNRGATMPDFGLHPIPRADLACLAPHEIGDPQYTIEGWLEAISH